MLANNWRNSGLDRPEHDVGVEPGLGLEQRREPTGRGLFVVIQERHEIAAYTRHGRVARVGDAAPRLVDVANRETALRSVKAFDQRLRRCDRVVIGDHDLDLASADARLGKGRAQRTLQGFGTTLGGNDDGDPHGAQAFTASATGAGSPLRAAISSSQLA